MSTHTSARGGVDTREEGSFPSPDKARRSSRDILCFCTRTALLAPRADRRRSLLGSCGYSLDRRVRGPRRGYFLGYSESGWSASRTLARGVGVRRPCCWISSALCSTPGEPSIPTLATLLATLRSAPTSSRLYAVSHFRAFREPGAILRRPMSRRAFGVASVERGERIFKFFGAKLRTGN